jgi:hypothetical protein
MTAVRMTLAVLLSGVVTGGAIAQSPVPRWRIDVPPAPASAQVLEADRCVPGEPAFADRERTLAADRADLDVLARDLQVRETAAEQKARDIESRKTPLTAERRRLVTEASAIDLLRKEIAQLGSRAQKDELAARRRIQAIEILNRRVSAYNESVRALTERQNALAAEIAAYEADLRETRSLGAAFASRARDFLDRWNAFAAQVPVAVAQCPRAVPSEPSPGKPGQ